MKIVMSEIVWNNFNKTQALENYLTLRGLKIDMQLKVLDNLNNEYSLHYHGSNKYFKIKTNFEKKKE